jgi:4-aminobutyrate aminotransferase-like enzyme
MIGVELVKNQKTKLPAAEEAEKVRDICRTNGILVGQGGVKNNVIRIQPPLVISREQIDTVVEVMDQSLKKVS